MHRMQERMNDLLGTQLAEYLVNTAADDFQQYKTDAVFDRPQLDHALWAIVKTYKRHSLLEAIWNQAKRYAKRTAVFLSSLLVLFSVLFLQVDAFRIQVLNFFQREHELHTDYGPVFTDAELKKTGFRFVPAVLPDGYTVISKTSDANRSTLVYSNDSGQTFLFEQFHETHNICLDAETGQDEVDINGNTGYRIQGKGTVLLWQQEGNFYCISGEIDGDMATKIARNLRKL